MVVGNNLFQHEPKWYLWSSEIDNENELEILGTVYTKNGGCEEHINNRIRKCRQSYYGLSKCGMVYPGATSDVKCYLWKSICNPVMMYGLDCINIDTRNMKKLQGNLVKQSMGLSKRAHTTELMASLNINKIYDIVKGNTVSLLKRIFKVQSPLKRLTIHMLSQFISKGTIVPGTIVSNILSMGLSPVQCAFSDFKFHLPNSIHDNGHIDSIRAMVFHENFIKPYSEEHTLVYLLTKSF